jgi:hypothetical protein
MSQKNYLQIFVEYAQTKIHEFEPIEAGNVQNTSPVSQLINNRPVQLNAFSEHIRAAAMKFLNQASADPNVVDLRQLESDLAIEVDNQIEAWKERYQSE